MDNSKMPRFRFKSQIWEEIASDINNGMDKMVFDSTLKYSGTKCWECRNKQGEDDYIVNYDQFIEYLNKGQKVWKEQTIRIEIPRFRTDSFIISEVESDENSAANYDFIFKVIEEADAMHGTVKCDEDAEFGYVINYDELIEYLNKYDK